MDGAWGWIMAAIAAIAGYVVGSSRSRQVLALAQHDFKIKVTKHKSGDYSSDTDIKSKKVKGLDLVVWEINDKGGNELPADSIVFLRFPGGSPLDPAEPNDGGRRTIKAEVLTGQTKTDYDYKVYYKHMGTEHLLEDPELIIEGDRNIVVV